MDCVNTQENKFKSMENDNASISLQKFSYKEEEELSESMKFSIFKLPTTNNDEHVPLGKSQPWKLVDRTIGKINLHLETNIPSFLDQATEIDRHIDGKSISTY